MSLKQGTITMTNHTDILKQAATILGDRGRRYGSVEETFDRCAKLATIILGKQVTMYDAAIILSTMKMARITSTPSLDDNYVDGINYLAFASQFSTSEEQAKTALEEDIAAMARKFAPRRAETEMPQIVPTEMPKPQE